MNQRLAFSTVFVLSLTLAGVEVATAAHNGHEFKTAEQCMQSGTGFDSLPRCSRSGSGPWIAQYGPPGEDGISSAFGAFLAFALLWAAAPAVISGFIASGRGQSVGLAVLLGLVLGWIGLVIVAFTFKPEVARAARNVIDNAARSSPSPSPRRDAGSRLEELDRLKRERIITEDEYRTRRAAILEEI